MNIGDMVTRRRHLGRRTIASLLATFMLASGGAAAWASTPEVGAQKPPGPAAGPKSVIWQGGINPDGSTQYLHPGLSVSRTSAGHYSLTWKGFPGYGFLYLQGIGSAGAITSENTEKDGTGRADVVFSSGDALFNFAVIQVES